MNAARQGTTPLLVGLGVILLVGIGLTIYTQSDSSGGASAALPAPAQGKTPIPSPLPPMDPTAPPALPPEPAATPTPTPLPGPVGTALARSAVISFELEAENGAWRPYIPRYPPNEMGDVLILEYHAIGRPEGRWQRTPENFRADVTYLLLHGYYPVNLIDVVRGDLDHVPRGRRPVVLTFDDSSGGQFRYLEDGTVDPDCAVGILQEMHATYGNDWPMRATFFVLLHDADEPGSPLFRQAGLGRQKVQALVDWGMEVGSHTISHLSLSGTAPEQIRWELAVSQRRIEALVPGIQARSFSVPYGDYPADRSLLQGGYSETAEATYEYEAAVRVGSGPAPSPFSDAFDPFYIPRLQAIPSYLDHWLGHYERHPEDYYVSDGGS